MSSESSESTEKKGKFFTPGKIVLMLIVAAVTAYVVYQMQYKKRTFKDVLADIGKGIASPTGIVAILGFVLGIGEFIVTDNVNTHGFVPALKSGKLFTVDKKKLVSTTATLAITSILTGLLTDLTLRLLPQEAKDSVARRFLG